jgi:hypothetical protein
MEFSNGSAIDSFSEMPLHSNVLKEDCSLRTDLHYVFAVTRRRLTRNSEPLEEEGEKEE